MKSIQVRFNVEDEVTEFSCLYVKDSIRGCADYGRIASCSMPEVQINDDSYRIFLRGEETCYDEVIRNFPTKLFKKHICSILQNMLLFDEYYGSSDDDEHYSEIIINGNTISFDTNTQKLLLKLLRAKV